MLHKQIYLTILSGLFICSITNAAQQPNANNAHQPPIADRNKGTEQLYKAAGTIISTQVNSGLDLLKEKHEWTTPLLTKAQVNHYAKQEELANKQVELNGQQQILNNQQQGLNKKQEDLTDRQITLTDKQIQENDIDRHLKRVAMTKETLALLDPNDPVAKEQKERLKLQMMEFNKDLPEVPKEEPKKTEPEKKDEAPKQDGFFTSLATYCVLGATAAGTAADTIADYSFKYITDLDCFKDTFIGKHSLGINRALVAVTATILAYKGYSLYKAYQAERNFKEEDIFNDDLD